MWTHAAAVIALGLIGRVRTLDPSQGRVIEPVQHYPDMVWGEGHGTEAPHFELVVFSTTECGAVVPLELEMIADGAPVRYA